MVYQQQTLSQLTSKLQDRFESVPFFELKEGYDAIVALQEAMRWWNIFTAQWKGKALVPTVAATSFPTGWLYSTPSPLLMGLRASWQSIPLKPASRFDLDLGYRNWRAQSIGGAGVPSRPTFWAPVGISRFAIWPADTTAGNPIELDGVAKTPILAADPGAPTPAELSAFVDLGAEEEAILLDEAEHLVAFKLGGTYWKKTFPGHERFLRAAVDKNSRLAAETIFRKIMGLDRARFQRPQRREVDPGALGGQG